MLQKIVLTDAPSEVSLIIEHPTRVLYEAQVAGVACSQALIEGVLVPLELAPERVGRLISCTLGIGRVSAEIADAIDQILAEEPDTRFLRVDRGRMSESVEAWVFVLVDSPESNPRPAPGSSFAPALGFGSAKGVLTWPNSD